MKKSIPFLALLLCFSFACNKGNDSQTSTHKSTIVKPNADQSQAEERSVCCCDLIVSSTRFGGLTVCGATGTLVPLPPCSMSTTCGLNTCGGELVVGPLDKDVVICYETDCPLCITNNSMAFPIQIYLDCAALTGPINIPTGGTVCFLSDCNGNLHICP